MKVFADGLATRERTLMLLAASTGLRQSELFGLQWGDINFAAGTMNVTRSILCGVVGPCKTESSQKPVPIHPLIVEALVKWKEHQRYRKVDDWVFASKCRRGRKPYWGQAILRKYIRPKAQELGIEKNFGWHTFRHYAEFGPCHGGATSENEQERHFIVRHNPASFTGSSGSSATDRQGCKILSSH
jgi:integrase